MTTNVSTADTPSADLLDRYFAGKCTQAEVARIRAWAGEHADGDLALRTLYQLGQTDGPIPWKADAGWKELAQRIEDVEPKPIFRQRGRRGGMHRLGYTIAVSLIGVFFLFAGWQHGIYRPSVVHLTQGFLYATAEGKQATVTLPDGSVVLLNVASRLEVPSDYESGNRTLRLTGEAFFTVVPQADAPFTVIAGSSITRVLGTRFLVRQYESDTSAIVAVQDGKVAVRSAVLTAQQEIEVGPYRMGDVHPVAASRFNVERGVLTLDGVLLEDAIHDLNRWFGADVRLGDAEIGKRVLAGEYDAGSVGKLAEILKLTFDLRVVRSGRILTLYSRG